MDYRSPAGYDRTRNAVIGHKDFDLTYLDEAYTSEHWLVRIYRYESQPSALQSHYQELSCIICITHLTSSIINSSYTCLQG